MQRLIFAAAVIFPVTFFCAGGREFLAGSPIACGGEFLSMKKLGPAGTWPSPELEHARGESLLGGKTQ
jgi:hypothetical protein